MRFKKIYIEITNSCNLNCSFCHNNNRSKHFMNVEKFKEVISKIKGYTEYIYLHVKGEPLLHPNLEEILAICEQNNIKVNITTNGTLLKTRYDILKKFSCVRQLNISLHSENNLLTYYDDVFETCKELSQNMFISYRLWTLKDYKLDKKSTDVVDKIIKSYNLSTNIVEKLYCDRSVKIFLNTFANKDNLFSWPTLDAENESDGFCYGLNTHIGILVDGTVVPCCLDGEGIINLGNIFEETIEEILQKGRTKQIIENFNQNKCSEELCKKCEYKNRFIKK